MKIRRSEFESDFVQVPNATARDRRLSFKARGILTHVLSQRSGWSADAETLAGASDEDGRTAVLSGLKELQRYGYLVRVRVQGDRGRWVTESVIYDRPQVASSQVAPEAGSPTSENPTVGRPDAGSPDVGRPDVGPPAGKRGKTRENTEGGRSAPPRPPADATHGGRHPAGNPLDVGCKRCGEEKAAASAAAVAAAKQRERDAVAAARAARNAELAATTAPPPGITAAYRQQRASRSA